MQKVTTNNTHTHTHASQERFNYSVNFSFFFSSEQNWLHSSFLSTAAVLYFARRFTLLVVNIQHILFLGDVSMQL